MRKRATVAVPAKHETLGESERLFLALVKEQLPNMDAETLRPMVQNLARDKLLAEACIKNMGELIGGQREMCVPLEGGRTAEIRLPADISVPELGMLAEMLLCLKEQREAGAEPERPDPEAHQAQVSLARGPTIAEIAEQAADDSVDILSALARPSDAPE